MKTLFIPFILFFGISTSLFAQEKSHKEITADKYYFRYAFDDAIESYTEAKVLTIEGQRNLAKSYQKMNLNTEAEAVYSKFINTSAEVIPEDFYNYAMVLRASGKYDEARAWMDKFAAQKPLDLRAKSYISHRGEFSKLLIDNGKVKVNYLNTNGDADDFGTCYYKDKIVYSSTNTTKRFFVKKYNWSGKPFWNIYVAEVDNSQLKNAAVFNKKMNGKMHDGPASFTKDGNFMAFTRNYYDMKRKDKVVELQICFSTYSDGKWSKATSFIHNNKDYSVGQPCLSADGNTMYFTSDMPGGFGGADLYKVTKSGSGEWSTPENLGNKINTEGDEMYPYLEEKSNILFFSSNGHYGLGGLDVFMYTTAVEGFEKVQNMGAPLNTKNDDFAMIMKSETGMGYFSSNRAGGSSGDDIYSFEVIKESPKKASDVQFFVSTSTNIPEGRRVRETFPIRNYVFFDLGSVKIPNRYVLINKDQVKDFKEDQLEVFTPKMLEERPSRQMVAYYNVLNILGDRMGKNPESTIKLVGASEKGPQDGREMAMSVKQYLVEVFGISGSRIIIEGRNKPKLPSEQPGGTLELGLLREGDRRVSIESTSPALLMEFQSGKNAPLKPVVIDRAETEPNDNFVTFSIVDSSTTLTSWTLQLIDNKGITQSFGPFTQEKVSLSSKSILGLRANCDFKAVMTGTTKAGTTIAKDTTVNIALWIPAKQEEGMRFSVIYEFNDSKAILIYKKYITEIVTPKIPIGATVIIRGYTDVIGESENNKKLSLARANDVKKIFENALLKAGRKDVKFEVSGMGEDLNSANFGNKYPEERFYNRTVVIDIIPKK